MLEEGIRKELKGRKLESKKGGGAVDGENGTENKGKRKKKETEKEKKQGKGKERRTNEV